MPDNCLLVQEIHQAGIERLKAEGLEVRKASRSDMQTVAREVGDAVAVITRNAGFSAEAIVSASRLKVIGNHGSGLDRIDLNAAHARGIKIVSTPDANTVSTAEQALGLMLALAKQTIGFDHAVRRADFAARERHMPFELRGKVLGILGFGRIGQTLAQMAHDGLGMEILHLPPRRTPVRRSYTLARNLEELLAGVDVLSLHLPLTIETRNLIDREAFACMKRGACIINTGRAATVDSVALCQALSEGKLAGAGLDVFDPEPFPRAHPLLKMPNVVLSPHAGGATPEALKRAALGVAEQVLDVLAGRQPAHLVSLTHGK